MSNNKTVGEKIRAIRESKNISLEEMSERTGLSTKQIENVEQHTHLPSLAPLIKIARALACRLGTFLDDRNELGPAITRKNERDTGISFSNNATDKHHHMEYFPLAKAKSGRHIEPFVIDIEPSGKDVDFTPSSHEGEEFIYCLEGLVEINYGKNTYQLEAGDSIYYDSIIAHHIHAKDEKGAKILAVVYAPF
ncbi:MAG: XRE family transcriptional regulator [Dysgonamonadaceae bacterium]|jgi:transcriptional regulator with XRE-family HTH domain|nr:XRE family transcriptional regulator [Dysgonamonadaceae bacterium]